MTHECSVCHGEGTVPCIRCGGSEKLQGEPCYLCEEGKTKCGACGGVGIIRDDG